MNKQQKSYTGDWGSLPIVHWSADRDSTLCGAIYTPNIKRTAHRDRVTCVDCLAVDKMAKEASRCLECDGTGIVEKCDWPGEHANRYQEPCSSCRPVQES